MTNLKSERLFGVAAAVVLLGGCASIVSKSEYPVTINSKPDGAQITVVDANDRAVYKGETPARVTLAAGRGYFKGHDYRVKFEKEGFSKAEMPIERGIDGWYIGGNILVGGLIGWFIVDPLTGAMYTLPKEVSADLRP